MKKRHFLYALLAIAPAFAFVENGSAQEVEVVESITLYEELPGKTYYYSDSFWNNWYISAGAGGDMRISSHGKSRWGLALDLAVGKWVSPYWGLRLNFMGGELNARRPLVNGHMNRIQYFATYADLTFNLSNAIWGYDESRIFSIIPFAGFGFDYGFKNNATDDKKTYAFPMSGGLKFNFCVSHYIDLFAEARANIITPIFFGYTPGNQLSSVLSVVGGISVKLGKDRFNAYNPTVEKYVINDLNNRVNMLREALDICESRQCPPCPEAAVIVAEKEKECEQELTAAVRFTINSSVITSEEAVNVYNIAHWLKKHENCKVCIMGYADKDTGTAAYNMALSKRRAEAVQKVLIEKYGIAAERVQMVANGSDSQPYPDNNNWNRVVVFSGME